MYQTSDNYKQLIYADSTKHLLNIYIEGNKVNPDYIFDFNVSHNLFSNDEFCLGSVTAKTIEFKIYKNSLPERYNNIYVETGIENEIVPIGYFILESIDRNDDDTITIKAIDYMIKFEFNYDGSVLNYPCTVLTVLKDICLKAGVELGSTSFLNSNKQIAVYDSTVSAREYLSYITEQAGGFAYIGRDGKLYIKTIGEDITNIDIELFQNFTWEEQFKVSRIAYEDGVQDFKFGDETNNTIWINTSNMYIVNKEQIEKIYNKINNFECYSFEGSTIIDPALDIGDIVIIDGKKVIYQGDMDYLGKFKVSISSKIQAKAKEETTRTIISDKTKIRRVQSEINQIEGKIIQLVQETSEHEEKITKVEQDVDSIKQKVSDIADYKREVNGVTEIHLTDSGKQDILKLEIKGNKTYESNLYSSVNIYPNEEIFPNMEGSELL